MTTKRFAIAIPSVFNTAEGQPTPSFHIMNIVSGDMPQFQGKNRTLIAKKFCEMSGFELDKKYLVQITQGYDHPSTKTGELTPSITFTKVSEVTVMEMMQAIKEMPATPYTLALIGEEAAATEVSDVIPNTDAIGQ